MVLFPSVFYQNSHHRDTIPIGIFNLTLQVIAWTVGIISEVDLSRKQRSALEIELGIFIALNYVSDSWIRSAPLFFRPSAIKPPTDSIPSFPPNVSYDLHTACPFKSCATAHCVDIIRSRRICSVSCIPCEYWKGHETARDRYQIETGATYVGGSAQRRPMTTVYFFSNDHADRKDSKHLQRNKRGNQKGGTAIQ